ncbi:hypothetical protein CDAR_303691 [Caerostris darwini]|uniref:Uncharacterized protein n=1 Tax=Caerostris darwini TaxID=1538125 RepID=A0AAV4US95_9ARAC|nr:hypothetical protein CDAR_303691 [Caerostris darwini]
MDHTHAIDPPPYKKDEPTYHRVVLVIKSIIFGIKYSKREELSSSIKMDNPIQIDHPHTIDHPPYKIRRAHLPCTRLSDRIHYIWEGCLALQSSHYTSLYRQQKALPRVILLHFLLVEVPDNDSVTVDLPTTQIARLQDPLSTSGQHSSTLAFGRKKFLKNNKMNGIHSYEF